MTLRKLKELVDEAVRSLDSADDMEVVIPCEGPSPVVGPRMFTPVDNVNYGIDWDATKIFIMPESKLAVQHEKTMFKSRTLDRVRELLRRAEPEKRYEELFHNARSTLVRVYGDKLGYK
jgi:hypothetical protein